MELNDIKPDLTLNAKGLSCPMPLLKTKKAFDRINSGQILEILSTDPLSKNDFPGWCMRAGHTFLGIKEEGDLFRFYVKKK